STVVYRPHISISRDMTHAPARTINSSLYMLKLCAYAMAALAGSGLSTSLAQQIQVPMSPDHFNTGDLITGSSTGTEQFAEFLGRQAVYLPSGLLTVKDVTFRDGIMEADVAAKPGGLFIGMAFRIESGANMEVVYLRPGASDTVEAVQYTPRLNGDA